MAVVYISNGHILLGIFPVVFLGRITIQLIPFAASRHGSGLLSLFIRYFDLYSYRNLIN